MKKVLTAAIILMAATAANAAEVDWKIKALQEHQAVITEKWKSAQCADLKQDWDNTSAALAAAVEEKKAADEAAKKAADKKAKKDDKK